MFPHLIIHFLDNYHVPLNGPLVFKTTQAGQTRKPKSQVTSYDLPKVVHHLVAELGFQAHLTPEPSPSGNPPALPLLAPVTVASQLGCTHICADNGVCAEYVHPSQWRRAGHQRATALRSWREGCRVWGGRPQHLCLLPLGSSQDEWLNALPLPQHPHNRRE